VRSGSWETSATGRIHGPAVGPVELMIDVASYGAHGAGAEMHYTLAPTPFGRILLAATRHGACWIGIHESAAHLESELHADYPRAQLIRNDLRAAPLVERVVGTVTGSSSELDLPVDICATPFQLQVWQELCAIPRGMTRSYGAIASRMGLRLTASRAVGHANGANPLAVIIPCHRVIGADGTLTGYRWGVEYKRRLLVHEGALTPLDHQGCFRLESALEN
jgi:AraC family transcriptional regulator, regulatory protein of adaptative response / methylated-DNA-[protein]-cysteine methyltransferase